MTRPTPAQPLSAEGRRGERRAEACALLADARAAAGLSTIELAHDVGCAHQAIQKMEDASDVGHPVHLDVAMAPSIAKHAVRLLARRSGMVAVELPASAQDSYALEALAQIQRETSDVVTTALESFADGAVTRAENATIRAQLDEAIEALAKFKRALELAADEASVNVRAIGARR